GSLDSAAHHLQSIIQVCGGWWFGHRFFDIFLKGNYNKFAQNRCEPGVGTAHHMVIPTRRRSAMRSTRSRVYWLLICALLLSLIFPIAAGGQERWSSGYARHRSVVVYNYQPRPYVVYRTRPYNYRPGYYVYDRRPYED